MTKGWLGYNLLKGIRSRKPRPLFLLTVHTNVLQAQHPRPRLGHHTVRFGVLDLTPTLLDL